MPLPDNHFFEVTWRHHHASARIEQKKGIVLEWMNDVSVVLEESLDTTVVDTRKMTVTGIVSVATTPIRHAGPPNSAPPRNVTIRGRDR